MEITSVCISTLEYVPGSFHQCKNRERVFKSNSLRVLSEWRHTVTTHSSWKGDPASPQCSCKLHSVLSCWSFSCAARSCLETLFSFHAVGEMGCQPREMHTASPTLLFPQTLKWLLSTVYSVIYQNRQEFVFALRFFFEVFAFQIFVSFFFFTLLRIVAPCAVELCWWKHWLSGW